MASNDRPFWDNKNLRGQPDRSFVSLTEPYERDFFIDQYLKTRNYVISDKNRSIVWSNVQLYRGRVPIVRRELEVFLDQQFNRRAS